MLGEQLVDPLARIFGQRVTHAINVVDPDAVNSQLPAQREEKWPERAGCDRPSATGYGGAKISPRAAFVQQQSRKQPPFVARQLEPQTKDCGERCFVVVVKFFDEF